MAGSAALAVSPFISTRVTRALAAASAKKLGFALCGLGSLSTHQIAPALQKTANCRLAGIVTGTPAKPAWWKARYGIPDKNIYSYETMPPHGRQSGHRRGVRGDAERDPSGQITFEDSIKIVASLLMTAAVAAGLSGAGAAFAQGRIEPSKINAALDGFIQSKALVGISAAVGLKAKTLAEKPHHVVLEAIGYRAGVSPLIHLETVRDSILVESVM